MEGAHDQVEEKPTLAQGSDISLQELSSSKLFPTIPEAQAEVGGDRDLER